MSSSSVHPSKGSRTANYLKGVTSGYVVTVATVLVGLWLTPFILCFLDRAQFGIFTLAIQVLTWLPLLDFGIASALRIQVAQLTERPERERLDRLVSTAFFTQSGVVLAVVICGSAVALFFPHFFEVRPEFRHDATMLVLLLLLGTAVSIGADVFSALLIAHQQIHVDNTIRLLNLFLRTILVVVLLKAGWGLYALGVGNIAARMMTALLAVVRTYRLVPGLNIRWRNVSWDVLKGTGTIGIWFTVGGVAGILIGSLDGIMTGKLFSLEMVTTLILTARLYALGASLLDPITNTARPMLAQLIGQGNMEGAAAAYHELFRISTGLALVMAATIWAGNGAFVPRWVGAHNYGGWVLDLALALRLVANSWVLPNRATLAAGLYRLPQHALSRLVEGVLVLVLCIWLGSQFGVVGIVFATCIGAAAISGWVLPLLTAQMFKQPLTTLLVRDVPALALLALVLVPVAVGSRKVGFIVGGGFPGAFAAGSLCGAVGLTGLWVMGFDRGMRKRLLARVTQRFA